MSGRSGAPWRTVVAVAGMLILAIAVVMIVVAWRVEGYQAAVNIAGLVGVALALPPLVVGLVAWRHSAGPATAPGPAKMLRAKDVLAGMVAEQWKTEAAIRSLEDPDPMPVHWRLTGRTEIMDHPANVASDTLPLGGSSAQIAVLTERFRALRRRRLVIVGGPGAGKTTLAVQLLRELLATRREGEPVPVLLSVASWDTAAFPRPHDWLAERLAQDYRALCSPEFGAGVPQALAARGHILPVLDGLDELPDGARTAVITALNRWLGDDQLILTSRTAEFFHAVLAAGDVLRSAAVIEPQPLAPARAADYLQAFLPPDPGLAWGKVLAGLRTRCPRDEQATMLAEITSTPLGLWLLRTAYRAPGADPAELLQPGRFRTTETLHAHLLDQLIPALITARPPSGNPGDLFRPHRAHDPENVRDWLGYIAHHLDRVRAEDGRTGTRDFAWWRLARHTVSPRTISLTFGLLFGLVFGLANGFVFGLVDRPIDGLVFGLMDGFAAGLVFGLAGRFMDRFKVSLWLEGVPGFAELRLVRRVPSRARFTWLKRLGAGLVFGLAIGLGVALMDGFVDGLLYGRADWLSFWLANYLISGVVDGLVLGLVFAFVLGLVERTETPTPADQASTPMTTWRADRVLNLLRAIAGALVVGLIYAPLSGLLYGFTSGLMYWLVVGLGVGLGLGFVFGLVVGDHHAWPAYVMATCRLAWTRRLPRRLMPFLADMHRIGLLRAVGPIYQFRHAELQDHLATTYRRRMEASEQAAHPPGG